MWLILSGDSRHHRPPVRTHLPADPRLAKAGRWHYPGAAPAEQGWAPLWAAHPPAEGPQACPFSLGLRFTWKQGTCPHRLQGLLGSRLQRRGRAGTDAHEWKQRWGESTRPPLHPGCRGLYTGWGAEVSPPLPQVLSSPR